MSSTITAPDTARQDLFVNSYLPVLRKRLSWRFRNLDIDAREEAIADCVASAWRSFQNAGDHAWDGVADDRRGKATPTRLADYIGSSYHTEGREFLGRCTTDALAPACRKAGRTQVRRIDGERLAPLHADDVAGAAPSELLTSEHNGPATKVRIREDWKVIAGHCKPMAKAVLGLLIRGYCNSEISRKRLPISPGRVSQIKHEIASVASGLGYGPRRWCMSAS